ncbi:MAG: hypothetical protein JNL21_16860 [Myxococcales bacterium]|nr:hypothetical protein [Myxococcales bacterium]
MQRLLVIVPLAGCHLISGVEDYRYEDRPPQSGAGASGGAGGGSDVATTSTATGGAGGAGGSGSTGAGAGLPNGAPCTGPDQCASTFCSDGVCCDRPCDGVCEACRSELTGSPDGTCAGFESGTDPADECGAASCLAAGLCCGDAPDPPGGNCPSECTGGCDANNTCTIECGNIGCDGETVTCPPGFDCQVSCAGSHACEGAIILCPETHECGVSCSSGNGTCDLLEVVCSNGPCQISCPNGACDSTAKLTCGTNACSAISSGGSAPTVVCGASCDCQGG